MTSRSDAVEVVGYNEQWSLISHKKIQIQSGRNILTTVQVHTKRRVYKVQRTGLLYLQEEHINFNTSQFERNF